MGWPECEQDDRSIKRCQMFARWEHRNDPRKSTSTMPSAIGLAQTCRLSTRELENCQNQAASELRRN